MLASIYEGQGMLKEAEDCYLKLMSEHGVDDLAFYQGLARVYAKQGRTKEARQIQDTIERHRAAGTLMTLDGQDR
jgi:hypothetical protein